LGVLAQKKLYKILTVKHNKHKIAKRAAVQVETMKDYIKFLLRGNKTKDDDTNTDPYRTGNITLGNM
jgi:hypothetical protein